MTIRRMETGDIPEVLSLEEKCFAHPWTKEILEGLINDEGKIALVAAENSGFAGYISASVVLDEAELGNLAVTEKYRRQGIGEALMKALTDAAKTRGVRKLFLEVEDGNEAAARLYGKLGFEEYGLRKDYYGPGRHAHLMVSYF